LLPAGLNITEKIPNPNLKPEDWETRKWVIGKRLYVGCNGCVYEIFRSDLRKMHAAKVFEKKLQKSSEALKAIDHEIDCCIVLGEAPHICRMFKKLEYDDFIIKVLEMCSNGGLHLALKARRVFSELEV
jgi:serine/threonine protein kinase